MPASVLAFIVFRACNVILLSVAARRTGLLHARDRPGTGTPHHRATTNCARHCMWTRQRAASLGIDRRYRQQARRFFLIDITLLLDHARQGRTCGTPLPPFLIGVTTDTTNDIDITFLHLHALLHRTTEHGSPSCPSTSPEASNKNLT